MSLPLILRFSLTNEDRLIAYNAQLDNVCKPALRYSIITLGFLAILLPPALFLRHMNTLGLLGIAFIIAGAALVRAWLIAPIIKRNKIRSESGAAMLLKIDINESAIIEESGDTPKRIRQWDEIDRIVENPKGLIIYHHDGSLAWLPIRAFDGAVALDEFLNLAGRRNKL